MITHTGSPAAGLRVHSVSISFGGVVALRDVSFTVQPGQTCGLIGPNGAGKTTLFNCVSGFVRPQQGRIEVAGTDLLGLPTHRVVGAGVARTFQNLGLVAELDVLQNVLLGAHPRARVGFVRSAVGRMLPATRRVDGRLRAEAVELIDRLGLLPVAHTVCGDLPFGTLKRVELARALMTRPRVLMLDEPANGLTHGEVSELATVLEELKREYDLTLLLVEHHMGLVMRISDVVVVLDSGRIIAAGPPDEVRNNPAVIAAYLGTT